MLTARFDALYHTPSANRRRNRVLKYMVEKLSKTQGRDLGLNGIDLNGINLNGIDLNETELQGNCGSREKWKVFKYLGVTHHT